MAFDVYVVNAYRMRKFTLQGSTPTKLPLALQEDVYNVHSIAKDCWLWLSLIDREFIRLHK